VVAALLLTTAPADAAPVFTDAETLLDPDSSASSYTKLGGSGSCGVTVTGGNEPSVPIVENGGAGSASTSVTSSYTSTAVPGDTATGAASASGTGEVRSVGGNLSTLDLSVTGNTQLVNALGTSANCVRSVSTGFELNFELTVTQAGFLELGTSATGAAYGSFSFFRLTPNGVQNAGVGGYGEGLPFDSASRVFLSSGTYRGSFEAGVNSYFLSSGARSGTATVHGEFHVVGSQTAAVPGKGRKYVTLPEARSCATHAVVPRITGKRKKAGQVEQVKFFVNDTLVKKIRTPHRRDAVHLPVADDQAAEVVVEIRLVPTRRGKPGKVVDVGASYEACS
jgi:hypothetical protein